MMIDVLKKKSKISKVERYSYYIMGIAVLYVIGHVMYNVIYRYFN